jgi:hypothetical protein
MLYEELFALVHLHLVGAISATRFFSAVSDWIHNCFVNLVVRILSDPALG